MRRLSLVAAPVRFALRRLRARPLSVAAATLAFAGAAALIGWSSLAAALAQEENVRLSLRQLAPQERALRVVYYTLPNEGDPRATAAAAAVARFAAVTEPPRRVRIWHPVSPVDERGTRFVVPAEPEKAVALVGGRLPGRCGRHVCEGLALSAGLQVGSLIHVGPETVVRIVGTGALRPDTLPDRTDLGHSRAIVVRALNDSLRILVRQAGSTVVTTAPLDPQRLHGSDLGGLIEQLRQELVRLGRSDPGGLIRPSAPLAFLEALDERGAVARDRLLLVAGQGAALILAFAAFVASARRRESELLDEQLSALGASRWQVSSVRLVEAAVPSLGGTLLAVGLLRLAAALLVARRDLSATFWGAALPPQTLLVLAALAVAGTVLLLGAAVRPRRRRLGFGALEIAALAGLAVVLWQTALTGALDPERIAAGEGSSPVLLLLPALAFFAAAVLLLRVLPLVLRLGERASRGAPAGFRLAFVTAARSPAQAAAATTFLAVALGSAFFSLDYRATLDRQAHDQARFAAAARWRIVERSATVRYGPPDVTPLTRYARVSVERPTPVLRVDGFLREAPLSTYGRAVELLALPAARIPELSGWRASFSSLSRSELARRLRPRPLRLHGPRIAGDARELRVWARSSTDHPRIVVLHFLLRGQGFGHVRLGLLGQRWQRLDISLPSTLRGAQLLGVDFVPAGQPGDRDNFGSIDLGPVQQRRASGWTALPSLSNWAALPDPFGFSGDLSPWRFERTPVGLGIRFELSGTVVPAIRSMPARLPPLGALASPGVAAAAVDRRLTVDVLGLPVAVRVVGTSTLFPGVVDRPSRFLVLDYDSLFAALNLVRPGLAVPSEAWFFRPQAPTFADRLASPPFRLERTVGVEPLTARLLGDPLASGTRDVLLVAGIAAAALALLGLVVAALSSLASERTMLAEYEALGVRRSTLAGSIQVRLLALALVGVGAGLVGALLALRLVDAFVAVTGTAGTPLPPIATVVAWASIGAVLVAVAAGAALSVARLARRALRQPVARRLRA